MSECVGFNVPRHKTGHFGDEPFQAINCTGTDNQKQSNTTLHTCHTPETQKRNRKKTAQVNKTIYTMIWYGFYYIRSGNRVGPILTAPEPTRGPTRWIYFSILHNNCIHLQNLPDTNTNLICRLFDSVSLSHCIQCISLLLQLTNTHTHSRPSHSFLKKHISWTVQQNVNSGNLLLKTTAIIPDIFATFLQQLKHLLNWVLKTCVSNWRHF